MMLADRVKRRGLGIDIERLLRMALLHDWAETRVGDMPRTATEYFGAEARTKAEIAAFADIVRTLGAEASEYQNIHREYEARDSLEARLVKAADIIDLLIQAYALEQAGAKGLEEFWEVARTPNFQLPPVADEAVKEVVQSLLDARRDLRNAGIR
jgi:putative hydrolase of HD superfamily